jgi:hypothetical protein
MTIKNVAALLPDSHETKMEEDLFHLFEIDDWKAIYKVTSTC